MTKPLANSSRNLAGRISRPFSSSRGSWVPRNMMVPFPRSALFAPLYSISLPFQPPFPIFLPWSPLPLPFHTSREGLINGHKKSPLKGFASPKFLHSHRRLSRDVPGSRGDFLPRWFAQFQRNLTFAKSSGQECCLALDPPKPVPIHQPA